MSDRENAIGAYKIIEQVGTGGMATVYKAYQPKLERYVALKVMHKMFLSDTNFVARFEREARIVGRLDHPNIVPIYDYDIHNGQPYLAMKFIDGKTLKEHMREEPLTLDEIRYVMRSVCSALTYAHRQGVLHRDMKPSNIIIGTDGTPYLTDFGLARIAQQGESTLSVDMMLGTPHYISPEQAQSAPIDARADVYSVGIILYELVTGRLPFTADSAYAIIHKQINAAPPSPSQLNPEVTPAVEMVLLQALEKEPSKRYDTPDALFAAFEAALMASSMMSLDASRVQRAAQLGELISYQTPGGRHYSTVEPRPRAFHNEFGGKSIIVPVVAVDAQPAKHSIMGWLEIVIQRIRNAADELRAQLRDRSLRDRFGEAMNELGSDVESVKSLAQSQFEGMKTPQTTAKAKSANPDTIQPAVDVNSPEAWEMDEASIRRRAQKRVAARSGFIAHFAIYAIVIFILFIMQDTITAALIEGINGLEETLVADMGATDAGLVVAGLQQLVNNIPLWLTLALLWGTGIVGHALETIDQTARFRITRRQNRVDRELRDLYGEDWQLSAGPRAYKQVRRSVEKQSKRFFGLLTHGFVTVLLIVVAFTVLPVVEGVAADLYAANTGQPIWVTGWATNFSILLIIGWLINAIAYSVAGLLGINDRERAIRREMARERSMIAPPSAKAKRHITTDDSDSLPEVRLTEDGEFTDSFIDDINEKQMKT